MDANVAGIAVTTAKCGATCGCSLAGRRDPRGWHYVAKASNGARLFSPTLHESEQAAIDTARSLAHAEVAGGRRRYVGVRAQA